ncbi:MAG: LacI family DNA-binding transcriptional regulator [Erysipelotrichaceae bacterium]|nr:LacI family DNA-binding transcriptional regulator [Erysipelotrichaceae bacterium]
MSITAKELAKKLNLSAAAVSMALNNKPGVSTKTRLKVRAAAEKYGYDFSKINEKSYENATIHFVIYKKYGSVITIDNHFFTEVMEGISASCKKIN